MSSDAPPGLVPDDGPSYAWRRETGWWDALEIDPAEFSGAAIFDHLAEIAPSPEEHDFVLYTDGSGCDKGWGGYASVYERIDLVEGRRGPVSSGLLVAATYGSTVRRSEFNALLDGAWAILQGECDRVRKEAQGDEDALYKIGSEGLLHQLTGPDRVRILWYTDRSELAMSMLHGPSGAPLFKRASDRDLWHRWSFMSRHICLTPLHRGRNTVAGQAACDRLAGMAREALKANEENLAFEAETFYPTDQWQQRKTQKALF